MKSLHAEADLLPFDFPAKSPRLGDVLLRLSLQRRGGEGGTTKCRVAVKLIQKLISPLCLHQIAHRSGTAGHAHSQTPVKAPAEIRDPALWHLCKPDPAQSRFSHVAVELEAIGAVRGADSKSAILLGNAPK